MSQNNKRVKIEYEMPNGKTFQYKGVILAQDDNLITFNDDVSGLITLNVKRIILIKEVSDD